MLGNRELSQEETAEGLLRIESKVGGWSRNVSR